MKNKPHNFWSNYKSTQLYCFLIISLLSTSLFAQTIPNHIKKNALAVPTISSYSHNSNARSHPLGFVPKEENIVLKNIKSITRTEWNGAGFVLEHKGKKYLVTSAHVVDQISKTGVIKMFKAGAKTKREGIAVKFIGGDTYYDLAILELTDYTLPSLPIYNRTPQTGERLYAYGPQVGTETAIIGGKLKPKTVFKHDKIRGKAPRYFLMNKEVPRGYSGGPVCNAQGKIIGMTVMTKPNETAILPIKKIQTIIDETKLIENGRISRPFLGILFRQNRSSRPTAENFFTYKNIPKEWSNSTIIRINGEEVNSLTDILYLMENEIKLNSTIKLTLKKAGKTKTITVRSGQLKRQDLENITTHFLGEKCIHLKEERHGGLAIGEWDVVFASVWEDAYSIYSKADLGVMIRLSTYTKEGAYLKIGGYKKINPDKEEDIKIYPFEKGIKILYY